jgi:imidazolonepropionase-like amidohydrolase
MVIRLWALGVGLWAFAFSLFAQSPAGVIALVGARVIDGTGAAPISNATVLVTDGRIDRVGPSASLKVPAAATRVDLAGKFIIPGLINSHGHLNNGDRSLPVYDQITQQLRLYTRFGVTTVYALGDDGKESVRVSRENDRAPLDRARLYAAGGRVTAKSAEDARRLIGERHGMGVHIVKTGMNGNANDMPPEAYTALIAEAHKRNLRVASHLFNLADAKALVNAGLDVIAHSIRDRDVDAAFVADLKRRNVGYIATLTRDLSVFQYTSAPDYLTDPFFLRGEPLFGPQIERVKDPALHAKTQASPAAQDARKWLDQALRNLKLLSDGGVMIAMGTDSGTGLGRWQGYFEHVEMELMVKAGLTPMQTLVASTGNAAKVMKLDAQLGTLQPGKRADFVVLTADPLVDIRNARTIESVWIDGKRQVL